VASGTCLDDDEGSSSRLGRFHVDIWLVGGDVKALEGSLGRSHKGSDGGNCRLHFL
jgi:hypothetical protein